MVVKESLRNPLTVFQSLFSFLYLEYTFCPMLNEGTFTYNTLHIRGDYYYIILKRGKKSSRQRRGQITNSIRDIGVYHRGVFRVKSGFMQIYLFNTVYMEAKGRIESSKDKVIELINSIQRIEYN